MKKNANQSAPKKQVENLNFDELEEKIEQEIYQNLEELDLLKEERDKIGNPNALGTIIKDVVWDQFINQIGQAAGEDFIKKNRGLTLDLSADAHIQTTENFADGSIATHNYKSKEQLEANYDRFKNMPHKKFREEFVNPKMNDTLKRAGVLNKNGVETVTDIYTGRQIPTAQKLPNGKNNPQAAQREHVSSSAEIYKNVALQMGYTNEELAAIINDPENLQGYTTAERNNRKSDNTPEEMDSRDSNKHWEKANERSQKHIDRHVKNSKDRLESEGQATRIEESKKAGKAVIKAIIMSMLAELVKDIIQKLIEWFKSAKKNIKTLTGKVKEAIKNFIDGLKKTLFPAVNSTVSAIATMIIGPVVGLIKKAAMFIKQGWNSLKGAVNYLRNPENKNKDFSIKIMEVGKIVITGLAAGGAIVLSEVIEAKLIKIPGFGFEIPFLGSLANILGIFFGAITAGIIGAIALNLIDKLIAKKQLRDSQKVIISKNNEIIARQEILTATKSRDAEQTAAVVLSSIGAKHEQAVKDASQLIDSIHKNSQEINSPSDFQPQPEEDGNSKNADDEAFKQQLDSVLRDLSKSN